MFEELFKKVKTDVEAWAKTGLEQVTTEIVDRMKAPEPEGGFTLIRRFGIADRPISTGGIAIDRDSWRIESYDDGRNREPGRLVRLFEIDRAANAPACLFCCRARIRSDNPTQKIELKLTIQGQIDFLGITTPANTQDSRGTSIPASNEWQSYETMHHYTQRNYPGKVLVNLDFHGAGIAWIESVELLQASVKQSTST
jgi:hypothetical protein